MGKILFLGPAVGQNLVSAHRNRADILALSRIFSYHLWWQIGLVQNFLYPLAYCNSVGRENQRSPLNISHSCQTNNSLARATWEHHHTASATRCTTSIEGSGGCILVSPRCKQLPL